MIPTSFAGCSSSTNPRSCCVAEPMELDSEKRSFQHCPAISFCSVRASDWIWKERKLDSGMIALGKFHLECGIEWTVICNHATKASYGDHLRIREHPTTPSSEAHEYEPRSVLQQKTRRMHDSSQDPSP